MARRASLACLRKGELGLSGKGAGGDWTEPASHAEGPGASPWDRAVPSRLSAVAAAGLQRERHQVPETVAGSR